MITIPVYNAIILPGVTYYYQSSYFLELAGKDEVQSGDEVIFIFLKDGNNDQKQIFDKNDFHDIGIYAVIDGVNDGGNVAVKTIARVNIESLVPVDNQYEITTSERPEIKDMTDEELKKHFKVIKGAFLKYVNEHKWGFAITNYMMQWKSLEEIAVTMSSRLDLTPDEKYAIIAADKISDRTRLIEDALHELLEMIKVTNEAESATNEKNEKIYREDAIKKQIDFLQKQLDELHPENVSDVSKFEKLIAESGMNKEAHDEAEKVLNRMKNEGKNSPEYGMLYDYLDFTTSLSWKHEKMKDIDLKEAEKILDEDHYGLKKVKKRILEQIAVMSLTKKQSGSILLFVGAPGTGKTSIGQSIAKALGRKYVRVSLGGVRDEAEIRGHRRTYVGAMPGRIMDGIKKSGVSNPVMVLDEVDKLVSDYNGDPSSALLEVLDPEQNSTFTDHYMNVPYDLSDVFFVCTANQVDTIPEPLYNRMEVIEFNGYTASDKEEIAKQHLVPRAMEKFGLKKSMFKITDQAIRSIISDYTMESGVRGLKRNIETLCRVAAVKIVRGDQKSVTVGPSKLREYLDMRPVHHDKLTSLKQPGIVTGLAWTRAGGEILFIETMFTKGSGNVIITGQLGDVMKESAQIAVSLVKSLFPDKAEVFEKNDLHIHVPEGAVPKDGPSAGITLTTALASLVTKKPVKPDFAMTGEVSLRGLVMPIGGLPEKLMAADRAGVKTVFIPVENKDDLDEVADEVKNDLNIVPVKTVKDVLKKTGILD